jgi:methylenetetrahydrofolate--tRNA-(uracil-5-)-methyltransferase
LIPGLENAEFLKLGSIHRNMYINTPKRLSKDLSSKNDPWLFFAGQITGVEGYFESTCIGLLVASFIEQKLKDRVFSPPPRDSALGSLLEAITDPFREKNFQPTNINFGLIPPWPEELKDKKEKKTKQILRAQDALRFWVSSL